MIKGLPGTDVVLTVRNGTTHKVRAVTVQRAVITEPVVASETRTYNGHKIGIVALASFTPGAAEEVHQAVAKVLHEGAEGLVFDMRSNGGGLVLEAQRIASIFIANGLIVSMRGRAVGETRLYASRDAIAPKIPMAVLVDSNTASAAEIVTAALQDHHRATVVGTHTFGKGVFQEEQSLSNGGALDITVGEYFTPDGRNLGGGGVRQGAGVIPEVKVHSGVDGEAGLRRRSQTSPPSSVDGKTGAAALRRAARAARPLPHRGAALRDGRPSAAKNRRPGARRERGEGDIAIVRVGRRGRGALVERVVGRPDVARDVIDALLLDRGMGHGFPDEVEREARDSAHAAQPGPRLDLRELVTFTIDPADARDFDDAISAALLESGGVRIWVHIADVAAFVRAGSPLDLEARRRANSVYLPGALEPMLPHELSSNACSLRPGEDRLAVTAELELDEQGACSSARFYRSLIRSDIRLDYDRVQRILDGSERPQEAWAEPLALARRAAASLQARRRHAGALAIDSPEPEFKFDGDGRVAGAAMREQSESHGLIEQLMIAANEAVADLLERRSLPCLYRVHERPEPAAVERLVEQLASLDVPTPPLPDPLSPSQAGELVGPISLQVARHTERLGHGARAYGSLILRSLKPAVYSPRNTGHAGLGSRAYLHFTSPIRRYPDLVCHRALLQAIGEDETAHERSTLAELAVHCSEREREATVLEHRADDIASCLLLERELFSGGWDSSYGGEVAGLISAGAFIAFGPAGGELIHEGLLPVRTLRAAGAGQGRREWWSLNEQETILRGESSGMKLALGQTTSVRVERVDALRGRVDLIPAG